jgi:hypothetical protein
MSNSTDIPTILSRDKTICKNSTGFTNKIQLNPVVRAGHLQWPINSTCASLQLTNHSSTTTSFECHLMVKLRITSLFKSETAITATSRFKGSGRKSLL